MNVRSLMNLLSQVDPNMEVQIPVHPAADVEIINTMPVTKVIVGVFIPDGSTTEKEVVVIVGEL
jgi:hypothetical protein